MRTKRAALNSLISVGTFLLLLVPTFYLRKLFLTTLGDDLLGLTYLFQNIIGLLSLAELGFGTAITFTLYKPLAEKNFALVRSYLHFIQKTYLILAGATLLLGIAIIPFLHLFIKGPIPSSVSLSLFLLFLVSTSISYLFTYKFTLLEAAQEGYWVSGVMGITRLGMIIAQAFLLMHEPNIYHFILIQIAFEILSYLILHHVVRSRFSWVQETTSPLTVEHKKPLFASIRALFFHRIGGFVVFSTDNILISSFIGLQAVTLFNNYNMVIATLETAVSRLFGGVTAGIGDLLATDSERAYDTHKKLFFINSWISTTLIVLLFNCLNQFIVWWIGERYLLDTLTFVIILINFYIKLLRFSLERFQMASGLYQPDQWVPIIESVLNLGASLILLHYLGLAGVFIGTLISNLAVVFWVKPKIIYCHIFHKPLKGYFMQYGFYTAMLFVPLVLVHFITASWRESSTFSALIINSLLTLAITTASLLLLNFRREEFKALQKMMFIGKMQ